MEEKQRSGNKEWAALAGEPEEGRSILDPLTEEDVTIDKITLLLAHLINDSKYNVAKDHRLYAESSKEFLLNKGGVLEDWLRLVFEEDLERSLWKLRDFVFNGSVENLAYMRRMV